MKLPVITNSQARCYRRCPREHQLCYTLGYRPVQRAETLRFGSLIHAGLEAWWEPGPDRLERALDALSTAKKVDPYDLARARVLMIGYHSRWLDEPYEAIAVESEFRAPLVNPETGASSRTWQLGGKLDVLARHTVTGLDVIIEHKTSSEDISLGSPYWQRLQLDPQVSTYFAGAKAQGHDIAECVYDVIGKPGLRPAKATPVESRKYTKTGDLYKGQREHDETPEEFEHRLARHVAENPDRYYQRGTVVRLETEEADAAYDLWHTARMIRESEVAGRWPRNPDSCMRYGRACDYFEVCTGTASLDDETRFRRVDDPHEELSSEAA